MEHLIGNNSVVRDKPPRDKGTLVLANDLRKVSFESVGNGFGDSFEGDIAWRNRPVVTRVGWVIFLRDETNVSVVKGSRITSLVKDIENLISEVSFNNLPISVIEFGWEPIRTRHS
jgi:hypothetical protein